jgi:hypothetical protein
MSVLRTRAVDLGLRAEDDVTAADWRKRVARGGGPDRSKLAGPDSLNTTIARLDHFDDFAIRLY